VKTFVRCNDRTVFEIDPITTEAKTCGYYDAYCYSEWLKQCDKRWEKYYE